MSTIRADIPAPDLPDFELRRDNLPPARTREEIMADLPVPDRPALKAFDEMMAQRKLAEAARADIRALQDDADEVPPVESAPGPAEQDLPSAALESAEGITPEQQALLETAREWSGRIERQNYLLYAPIPPGATEAVGIRTGNEWYTEFQYFNSRPPGQEREFTNGVNRHLGSKMLQDLAKRVSRQVEQSGRPPRSDYLFLGGGGTRHIQTGEPARRFEYVQWTDSDRPRMVSWQFVLPVAEAEEFEKLNQDELRETFRETFFPLISPEDGLRILPMDKLTVVDASKYRTKMPERLSAGSSEGMTEAEIEALFAQRRVEDAEKDQAAADQQRELTERLQNPVRTERYEYA